MVDYKITLEEFLQYLEANRAELLLTGFSEKDISKIRQYATLVLPPEGMIKHIDGEYERYKNAGWKIHLHVASYLGSKRVVYEWLRKNCPYSCKYGLKADQEGKDFTIYVGSWDDVERFSLVLEQEIGNLLKPAGREVLVDDMLLSLKIGVRFDTFDHRYCFYGISLLEIAGSKTPHLDVQSSKKQGFLSASKIACNFLTFQFRKPAHLRREEIINDFQRVKSCGFFKSEKPRTTSFGMLPKTWFLSISPWIALSGGF